MSEFAAHETDYDIVEGEPPELMGRNLTSAAHLLASATAFFFLAFFFAYFYLRSLNNAGLWQPKDVDAVDHAGNARDGADGSQRRTRHGSASPTSAPDAGRSGASRGPSRSASGSVRSCCRSSSGHGRLRACERRLCERLLRLDGVQRPLHRWDAASGSRTCWPPRSAIGRCSVGGHAGSRVMRPAIPGRLGPRRGGSAVAPSAGARGVVLLLDVSWPGSASWPGSSSI